MESLTLARERGFEPGADQADACLLGLGEVALELGKLDEADAFAREALARPRRPHDLISSTVLLGRVTTRRGDHEGATAHFKHALHVFKNASGTFPKTRVADVSHILLPFTELWVKQGKLGAAAVIGFLLRHLHIADERAFAERLLAEAQSRLSDEDLEEAVRRGDALSVEKVVWTFLTST